MDYYFNVLKNYATFTGRASRKEYWSFVLYNFIISLILGFVGGLIPFELLSTIYTVAVLLPSTAVCIRRMHDVGKSGWYCLIPIYGLILACISRKDVENKYGINPKIYED